MVWAKEKTGLLKKEGVAEHINISLYVPTRLQHYYSFVPYIFLYILRNPPFSYFFLASLAFSVVAVGL